MELTEAQKVAFLDKHIPHRLCLLTTFRDRANHGLGSELDIPTAICLERRKIRHLSVSGCSRSSWD